MPCVWDDSICTPPPKRNANGGAITYQKSGNLISYKTTPPEEINPMAGIIILI